MELQSTTDMSSLSRLEDLLFTLDIVLELLFDTADGLTSIFDLFN